jgi:ferrous iron transport protein B
MISGLVNAQEIQTIVNKEISRIEEAGKDDTETLITDAKYSFISGALRETFKLSPQKRIRKTDIVDTLITHRVWGIPIFIFFMWVTFFSTFKLGAYPQLWIEKGVSMISSLLDLKMTEGPLKDMLIQGVIGGVGGVVVFLPNILLLYFFISLMEDTGYMARAVFIMDKAMHRMGLPGKSFIPLLMGFGCNVPAILSTRIIESRYDRLVTILINPFMSCSARLPVYILFIGAFFTNYQGSILFGMYGFGILLAVGSALLFRKTIIPKADIPFVMELPPYRIPTIRSILKHMWHRTEQYIRKIAGIILLASIIIWALGYFPLSNVKLAVYDNQIKTLETNIYNASNDESSTQDEKHLKGLNDELNNLKTERNSKHQELSYIGRLGKTIEPIMSPLGFDWKMSIGIISGIAAKEIVVGTLGVLYHATETEEEVSQSLTKKLQAQEYSYGKKSGQKIFNPIVALSFMLFILIYFPCIGVLAAIRKEAGHWKWALFTAVYTTALAWLISFTFYQLAIFFQ